MIPNRIQFPLLHIQCDRGGSKLQFCGLFLLSSGSTSRNRLVVFLCCCYHTGRPTKTISCYMSDMCQKLEPATPWNSCQTWNSRLATKQQQKKVFLSTRTNAEWQPISGGRQFEKYLNDKWKIILILNESKIGCSSSGIGSSNNNGKQSRQKKEKETIMIVNWCGVGSKW